MSTVVAPLLFCGRERLVEVVAATAAAVPDRATFFFFCVASRSAVSSRLSPLRRLLSRLVRHYRHQGEKGEEGGGRTGWGERERERVEEERRTAPGVSVPSRLPGIHPSLGRRRHCCRRRRILENPGNIFPDGVYAARRQADDKDGRRRIASTTA